MVLCYTESHHLLLSIYYNSKLVNTSFSFDSDFETESKYHCKVVVLFLGARVLSLQDALFGLCFFLYSSKLSADNGYSRVTFIILLYSFIV